MNETTEDVASCDECGRDIGPDEVLENGGLCELCGWWLEHTANE